MSAVASPHAAAPETCKHPAGVVAPVINRARCEGKADCVRVCPYDVFVIAKLGPAERHTLSLPARIKALVHGNLQAFAVHADHCHGCGLCVAACPEKAIELTRIVADDPPQR
jgi:NAD-dependent dihydropyrimidine dehydrogenase PreA subunit